MNKYKGCERYPEILDALRVVDPQIEVVIAGKASADIPNTIYIKCHDRLRKAVGIEQNTRLRYGSVGSQNDISLFEKCQLQNMGDDN